MTEESANFNAPSYNEPRPERQKPPPSSQEPGAIKAAKAPSSRNPYRRL